MGQGAMPPIEDLENEALWDIEQMLQQQGRSLSEFTGMPFPHPPAAAQRIPRVRQLELDLMSDTAALGAQVAADIAKCNPEQLAAFHEVMRALSQSNVSAKLFFLYASGGCGKTFLLNLLLRHCRANGHIADHACINCLPFNPFQTIAGAPRQPPYLFPNGCLHPSLLRFIPLCDRIVIKWFHATLFVVLRHVSPFSLDTKCFHVFPSHLPKYHFHISAC